jgi:hypothetical protein
VDEAVQPIAIHQEQFSAVLYREISVIQTYQAALAA